MIAVFFGVTLIVAVSLFCLTGKPGMWFDEGLYLHIGKVLAYEKVFGMTVAPGVHEDLSLISVGYPLLFPLAAAVDFFGPSVAVGRLLMVVFIVGFVCAASLLAQRLYGFYAGLITLFLLASFAPLYGNGRSVLGEVPGLLFLIVGLLFFHTVEQGNTHQKRNAFFAGLFFGLSVSTKPIFILALPALAVAVAVKYRAWWGKKVPFLFGLLGCAGAVGVWVVTQFHGERSFFRIFGHYVNPYSLVSVGDIIITNITRFFTETTPLHFAFLGVIFCGFLVYKYVRKIPFYGAEIFCFIFVALVAAQYVRTPGWYRYFFPAHVVLFIFLSGACNVAGEWCASHGKQWVKKIIVALPVALILIQAVQFYYNEHLCAQDKTTSAVNQFSTIGPQDRVLFYNTPELVFLFPRLDVYQYLHITDTIQVGKDSFAKIDQGFYDRIILPTGNFERGDVSSACYGFDATLGDYTFLKKSYEHCAP